MRGLRVRVKLSSTNDRQHIWRRCAFVCGILQYILYIRVGSVWFLWHDSLNIIIIIVSAKSSNGSWFPHPTSIARRNGGTHVRQNTEQHKRPRGGNALLFDGKAACVQKRELGKGFCSSSSQRFVTQMCEIYAENEWRRMRFQKFSGVHDIRGEARASVDTGDYSSCCISVLYICSIRSRLSAWLCLFMHPVKPSARARVMSIRCSWCVRLINGHVCIWWWWWWRWYKCILLHMFFVDSAVEVAHVGAFDLFKMVYIHEAFERWHYVLVHTTQKLITICCRKFGGTHPLFKLHAFAQLFWFVRQWKVHQFHNTLLVVWRSFISHYLLLYIFNALRTQIRESFFSLHYHLCVVRVR